MLSHIKLQSAIDNAGLSQRKLAEIIGSNQPYVNLLCNKDVNIRVNTLQKICLALGVNADDLLADLTVGR